MAKVNRAELPEKIAAFSPDIVTLSHDSFPRYALRSYQIPPARAITTSIEQRQGKSLPWSSAANPVRTRCSRKSWSGSC